MATFDSIETALSNDRIPGINYRAARAEDVPEMVEVFLKAASEMFAKNNVA